MSFTPSPESLNTHTHTPEAPQPDQPVRTRGRRRWVDRFARRFPIVDVIREDRRIHGGLGEPGCQTVIFHRLANWATSDEAPPPLVGHPARWFAKAGLRFCRLAYGIELPASTTLGRRVRIAHQNGIVLHRDVVIDDDVLIRQNVTIGLRRDEDARKPGAVPHLRSGVSVGAGAVIVGPVEIGEGATVGANAVVTQDVPAGGKAVAPSAEVHGPRAQ